MSNERLNPNYLTTSITLKIFLMQQSIFKPYQKHNGKRYTIGYGHYLTLEEGESFFPNGLTEEEAYNLFIEELSLYETNIRNNVKVKLTQSQFDALISISYSLSLTIPGLNYINSEDFDNAANSFLNYVNANGKRKVELVDRRKQEIAIFSQGNYPNTITRIPKALENTRNTMKNNAIRLIKRRYPILELNGEETTELQKHQARSSYFRMTGMELR